MPLTFKEALDFAESRKVALPEVYYGELQGRARDLAFSIAGVAAKDQLQGVLDSLRAVQKEGLTFEQWKARVKGGSINLGLPDHRLDNIFRTNMQVHYNVGHWQQQLRTKATRPFLMYDAVNDSRVRPVHVALDNVIKPIDDPFWSAYYPPNGFRCRCTTISLTEAQAKARGGITKDPEKGWPAPDKGWDYHPGKDPETGVHQAETTGKPTDSAKLKRAKSQRAPRTKRPELSEHATPEQIKAWFGEVEHGLGDLVKQTVNLFKATPFGEKRSWHASIFQDPLVSLKKMMPRAASVPGSEVAGLYYTLEKRIAISTRALKSWSVLPHEIGHHLDTVVLKLAKHAAKREAITGEYMTKLMQVEDAVSKASNKGVDSLLKSGRRDIVEYAAFNESVPIPSAYALTNSREWVAECFDLYLRSPQTLEAIAPKTFEAFELVRTGQ